ncbi:hypothetical protein GS4_23_00030 [Gordonia soli NBRC 108243]|uniref:Uncharacterized protein n=1 Tax=Gordonia soli NBRC 108243 TaxID=1223545 RepID=M0QLA5_9ACTN|nr:hypothetical protein GS4_23_00030 [Gordonia soli NBRC 108243]
MSTVSADELRTIELDDVEKDFLITGLLQWGGVVAMTDDLARALGYGGAADFYTDSAAAAGRISEGLGLTAAEWRRSLGAAEVAFGSEVLGLGHEWDDFSGFDADQTYQAMRRVQWKVRAVSE